MSTFDCLSEEVVLGISSFVTALHITTLCSLISNLWGSPEHVSQIELCACCQTVTSVKIMSRGSFENTPFIHSQPKKTDRKPLIVAVSILSFVLLVLVFVDTSTERASRKVGLWAKIKSIPWDSTYTLQSTDSDLEVMKKSKADYGAFKWHADLSAWDDRKGLGGKLIIVGDVHGMHEALKLVFLLFMCGLRNADRLPIGNYLTNWIMSKAKIHWSSLATY